MTKESFKNQAKKHQIEWKKENIGTKFDQYETWLTPNDAQVGKNFFDPQNKFGFNIFKGSKISVMGRYPKYRKSLCADILRSEHIPFNIFVPFEKNLDFFKNVLHVFLKDTIKYVTNIIIEYAPTPQENYLNDGTSFDTYVEYIHKDGSQGILGIEVKYTEKAYPLKGGSKEEVDINDRKSRYYVVSEKSGVFEMKYIDEMKKNNYRQLWRNHLLAESVRLIDKNVKHATSIHLYPKGNEHFTKVCKEYSNMLKQKDSFLPITYEDFLSACRKYCPNNNFKVWLDYLEKRYLI